MARIIPLPASANDMTAAMREAVAMTVATDQPGILAAMDREVSLMLRRESPGTAATALLLLARDALRDGRATRH